MAEQASLPIHHHDAIEDINRPSQEPVFRAWIKTTYDALLVFEAARQGLVPRVMRRFHDAEKRSMIVSGAVLVFTEEESGIKRWTDPFVWTASRMLGNFMIYRERYEVGASASPYSRAIISAAVRGVTLVRNPEVERCIYGGWNRGKELKVDGLMKKTISFPIGGIVYHLVSYYNPSDVLSGKLPTPAVCLQLATISLSDDILRNLAKLRYPPRIERDIRGRTICMLVAVTTMLKTR
ncbi:Gti1/Pac2 family-domain-containing protein [Cristinia sonorae]|uniref:Gti1/Pac2 family-domain-containing protein n=1 Tax=Cristinia sonorae TaxID=1940300 RepID=A0A8K0XLM5_9AGAR|nr:Gti1/Pac2 family-domain-containing protein [Cristinia sonorae]